MIPNYLRILPLLYLLLSLTNLKTLILKSMWAWINNLLNLSVLMSIIKMKTYLKMMKIETLKTVNKIKANAKTIKSWKSWIIQSNKFINNTQRHQTHTILVYKLKFKSNKIKASAITKHKQAIVRALFSIMISQSVRMFSNNKYMYPQNKIDFMIIIKMIFLTVMTQSCIITGTISAEIYQ